MARVLSLDTARLFASDAENVNKHADNFQYSPINGLRLQENFLKAAAYVEIGFVSLTHMLLPNSDSKSIDYVMQGLESLRKACEKMSELLSQQYNHSPRSVSQYAFNNAQENLLRIFERMNKVANDLTDQLLKAGFTVVTPAAEFAPA